MQGVFLTLEGSEGTGKTTNMAFVESYLREAGVDLLLTREPGGTPLGEELRSLILNQHDLQIGGTAELLMMFAARAQHIEQVIKPALAAGKWVISDRFTEASYAYQGAGRGLGAEKVALLETLVQGDLRPDLTLLLDIDPTLGLQRAKGTGAPDRIEQSGLDFFERVRAAYLERAEHAPARFCVIDASESLDEVQSCIAARLSALLASRG